jgi:hypothetical protein
MLAKLAFINMALGVTAERICLFILYLAMSATPTTWRRVIAPLTINELENVEGRSRSPI